MKKQDYVLIGAILGIALILYLGISLASKGESGKVRVQIGDEVVGEYSLFEDQRITLDGYHGGENVLVIDNGSAYMESADCPDKLCVKQGVISKKGEMILCLPHRIVVTVIAGDDALDGVSE